MASFAANRFAVRGRLVHATETPCVLEYVEDGLVVVDGGAIVAVAKDTPSVEALLRDGDPGVVVELAATDFLVPGLVDCHVHAAQYAYTGTATDKPLMEWLQHYTFPAERRCADVAYARRVYEKLVDRLLANGTTCSAMYATIHVAATKVLVDVCLEKGHRCVVGKVCMDRNGAEGYEETTAAALAGTEAVIEYVKARQPGAAPKTRVVQPCVVPRFIPTCTLPLLAGLGELAKKHDCWVQSHASETPDEMAFVESLHPGRSDSSIFDDAGLLTDKCVMAHCVYLDENELGLFAKRKCGVACCPLSNAVFSLSEGTNAFPLKRAHARGVPVGLGTDIAGGYATSMLSACRHAVVASKHAANEPDVDYRDAFWTATLGGARALGLGDTLGSFAVGKQFDACKIRCEAGVYDTFPECIPDGTPRLHIDFEQFLNLGDDRNVAAVFVQGRLVKGAV
ncbi:imidazolonepropionase [Aureococcus anophagefferens]|uniref:Guanine deaminase n=1 Tax=Aureococcus anophagefferens TaxID=44056 RepID=A0ABR1FLT0_AURAN